MAAENSPDVDTSLDSDSNPNTNVNADVITHDSSNALAIPSPAVCLVPFAGDAAGGAVMGSVFGYGDNLLFFALYYLSSCICAPCGLI